MTGIRTTLAVLLFLAINAGSAFAGARQDAKVLVNEGPEMAKIEE